MSRSYETYLTDFHDERPGITEAVLARALDTQGRSPYDRLVEDLPEASGEASVVDLACGSAPLAPRIDAGVYVGVDRSEAELALARERAPDRTFLSGDAAAPPLAAGSADVVLCSLALQILQPVDEVLAAVAALLRPGGTLVATLPGTAAFDIGDKLRWSRLAIAMRTRLDFPNDDVFEEAEEALADAGLRLVSDESLRHALPLRDADDARALVDSLYVPEAEGPDIARGQAVARKWVGSDVGISIRRLVAVREDAAG
jgi:SAM-dependent methyltransferase